MATKRIQDLENVEEVLEDSIIPVGEATKTKSMLVSQLKNWLSSFFIGKDTDEQIGGTKIFTSGNTRFLATNGNAGRIVSRGSKYGIICRVDDNDLYVLLTNENDPLGAWNNLRPLRIGLTNGVLYSSSNSEINGVVTTTGISKKEGGYVKLGNGIIIQWGVIVVTSYNESGTVTLPTPFTSLYEAVASGQREANNGQGYLSFGERTVTNFTYHINASTSNFNNRYRWIAIGI